MIIFIGIKYMLGAADAKANMKSAIVNWLIGAIMVFACTSLVGWLINDTIGQNTAGSVVDAGIKK